MGESRRFASARHLPRSGRDLDASRAIVYLRYRIPAEEKAARQTAFCHRTANTAMTAQDEILPEPARMSRSDGNVSVRAVG
jgi:hypothetical protein